MSRFCVLFVFVFAINQNTRAVVPPKVTLEVYYESKCRDSKDFIVDQLKPATSQLHGLVALKFIPFGKAFSLKHRPGEFSCQHGPTECLGNMVQHCALESMRGRSDVEKVDYLVCEMKTKAGTVRDLHCVQKANIPVAEVEHCLSSGRGVELQLEAQHATKQIRPAFIPTVTVNGIFDQEVQDSMMEDMMGTICSMYKDDPPCAQRYNEMAMEALYE